MADSYEQEEKEWLKNCEKELDKQAEKIAAEPNDDEIYKFEEKLNSYINTKEKEIKDEIKILEKDLPMFSGRAGAISGHNEAELRIGRRRAALDLGITRGDIKYNYLKKAGILSDGVENFESNLKVPSLNKFDNIVDDHLNELQSGFNAGMEEKEEEAKEEGKEFKKEEINTKAEKKTIKDQLQYIWLGAEVEKSNLSDEEKSMLKAAYSRNYKIDPMMVQEFEGTVKQIKKYGISENDIKNADPEIFNEAEEILREDDPEKKKNFIMKHGKKAIIMFIAAGLVLGIVDSLDDDVDLASNYQYPELDQDEEDENVNEEPTSNTSDSVAPSAGSDVMDGVEEVDEEKTDELIPGGFIETAAESVGEKENKEEVDQPASSQAPTVKTNADELTEDTKTYKDPFQTKAELAKAGETAQEKDSSAKVDLDKKVESDTDKEKVDQEEKTEADRASEKEALSEVRTGEGVSHVVMRQLIGGDIESDSFEPDAKHLEKMGYDGDPTDKDKIQKWSLGLATKIVSGDKSVLSDSDNFKPYYDKEAGYDIRVRDVGSKYKLVGDIDSGFDIVEGQGSNETVDENEYKKQLLEEKKGNVSKFMKDAEKAMSDFNISLDTAKDVVTMKDAIGNSIITEKPNIIPSEVIQAGLDPTESGIEQDEKTDRIKVIKTWAQLRDTERENSNRAEIDGKKYEEVEYTPSDIRALRTLSQDHNFELNEKVLKVFTNMPRSLKTFLQGGAGELSYQKAPLGYMKIFASGWDKGEIAEGLQMLFNLKYKPVESDIKISPDGIVTLDNAYGRKGYSICTSEQKVGLDMPGYHSYGMIGPQDNLKPGDDLNWNSIKEIKVQTMEHIGQEESEMEEGTTKEAAENSSVKELGEKGEKKEAPKELSEEEVERVVKDMDKKLTSKEKIQLKKSLKNPGSFEETKKIVYPLISVSMGGDGKKIILESAANHVIKRFFDYLSEKDSEKGKTEEIDLSGKGKKNKEEIEM